VLYKTADFWGSPASPPQIIGKRPCIYQFLSHYSTKFGFYPSKFLTSLRQCGRRRDRVASRLL